MQIIDIHTHTFPEKIVKKSISILEKAANIKACTSGTNKSLIESMTKAGIKYSLLLPVATTPNQVSKINENSYKQNGRDGLFFFGAMHPLFDNYKEELKQIKNEGLKGIKLHPDYQKVFFDDIRMKRIVDTATELGLYIMVHAGVDIGLPEVVHCTPTHVLDVLSDTGSDRLILAHMGGWHLWDEVYDKLVDEKVFVDTSFSIDNVKNVEGNMDKEKFTRLVRAFGADKVLFGTDSPWSDQSLSVDWINETDLTEKEKQKIFWDNSSKILGIS